MPDFAYPVHSLYLDSDDLTLYAQAVNDIEHRCQLRLRYSLHRLDSPVHFEVKQRCAELVTRRKSTLKPQAVGLVLAGHWPDAIHFVDNSAEQQSTLAEFVARMQAVRASPKMRVTYHREAYVSEDGSLRVTLDRGVLCQPSFTDRLESHAESSRRLFHPKVLLELNYERLFPAWFREMVESFGLTECEADKYLEAVGAWGAESLRGPA
jgi:hypothetical protein